MPKVLKIIDISKKYKKIQKLNNDITIQFKIIFDNIPTGDQKFKLQVFLKSNNVKTIIINDLYANVIGTINDINRIFQTEIWLYKNNFKYYYAESQDLILPDEVSFISSILGLNDIPRFERKSIVIDYEQNGYTPPQVGELYDFPFQFRGSNRVIAIIELGGGFKYSDLDFYFLNYLQLGVKPQVLYFTMDGVKNNPESSDAVNVTADIEIAGSIAKCSIILVYFAPNTELGFFDAVYFAMNNMNYSIPCALNISWGSAEVENTPSFMESMNKMFERAKKYNINVFCAAGNKGSSDGQKGLNVSFPASSQNVIACGGTTITVDEDKIVDEVVWSGTGGGYSKVFLKPLYQETAVTRKYRGVPDIAGNADPKTGYIIYQNGKLKVIGGTNTVSPLYSGLTALLSQARGSISYLNDIIYPNARTVCYDVVEGSNGPDGKWDATVGWDPCTGNGRIYGDKLLITP